MKKLIYGHDFTIASPADIFCLLEEWKPEIDPQKFSPLIPITGGMSLVGGGGRELQATLACIDFTHLCKDKGVSVKNAVICLAYNFDDHLGIVALSLETAMILNKPKSQQSGGGMDNQTYMDTTMEIYGKNVGNVRDAMKQKWNLDVNESFKFDPPKTRSVWRQELGHDVLIHPATLAPCQHDGKILRFDGTVNQKEGKADTCFKFSLPAEKSFSLVQSTFPSSS